MIRKSTKNDYYIINELLLICFGDRQTDHALNNLDNRYYLYFIDNKLVAMTGLIPERKYPGLEVDWTCTNPDYRHKGYMQELFELMLTDVTDKNVYCECWRAQGRTEPHLHSLLKLFNFKEVKRGYNAYKVGLNCEHSDADLCVMYTGENCTCYEDLYIREPVSN